jgi:nucleotide-binding universal stress UspA family protein
MKRLLVPTDFSEASRIAVGHAVELSEAVGAELLLLHVVDVTTVGSPHLASIRQAFRMTIEPTGNAFSCEVPRAADDQGLCAEAESKRAALLPPVDA